MSLFLDDKTKEEKAKSHVKDFTVEDYFIPTQSIINAYLAGWNECEKHVRESVSEQITKLQEELYQARKLITELVKMGEFYGNPESWVRGKNDGNMGINFTDREYLNPCNYGCNYGGKLARTVLSNNKDLIEKLTRGE